MTTQEIKEHKEYLNELESKPIDINDFELVPVYESESGLEIYGPYWGSEFAGFILKPKVKS